MPSLRPLIAALVVVAAVCAFALETDAPSAFEQGNRWFSDKSYKRAIESYREALKLDPSFAEKDQCGWQILQCLWRLKRYDECVAESQKFAGGVGAGTLWEARATRFLAGVYRDRPHYGYRNKDGDWSEDWQEGWQYVNTYREDRERAVRTYESAKKLYDVLAGAASAAPSSQEVQKQVREDLVSVHFGLASSLEALHGYPDFKTIAPFAGSTGSKLPDPPPVYDPAWEVRRKVLYLLDTVAPLDDSPAKELAARAGRERAFYLLRYESNLEPDPERQIPENDDPIRILRDTLAACPHAAICDELQFALALTLESEGSFVDALAEYAVVVDKYPRSKWASDARAHIQEIHRPRLNVQSPPIGLPDAQPKSVVASRNVGKVEFTAYVVDLVAALTSDSFAKRYENQLDGHTPLFDTEAERAALFGEKAATWTLDTKDDGTHQFHSDELLIPITKIGTYVVEAKGANLSVWTPVVISDLTVVKKLDQSGIVAYVVDSKTGAPRPDVNVMIRERNSWWDNGRHRWAGHVTQGKSDANGLFRADWWKQRNDNSSETQVLAWDGARVAISGERYWWRYGEGDGSASYRVFGYTDRPVYRPGQKVQFKAHVRLGKKGEFKNVPNERFEVLLKDPKGNEVLKKTFVTDARGALNGAYELPAEPPLGVYYLSYKPEFEDHPVESGSHWFRCEEYKKPEFLVEIAPDAEQSRLGEPVSAKVIARYVWGAPAPDCEVKYRVQRDAYWASYDFPDEYDWYYGRGYAHPKESRWDESMREELVAEGTAKTDAEGMARITFDTAKAKADFPDRDHEYQIHVDVVDQSRRTISAEGEVRVTRKQLFAYLRTPRRFYWPGDSVEVELRTETATGAATATKGKVTVSRMVFAGMEGNIEKWDEIHQQTDDLSTDAEGRAFYRAWKPDATGRFKIAYATQDAWGETVTGETLLWVVSKEFAGTEYHFRDVEVISDKRTYEQGETAHLMLSADKPGAHVLVAIEALDVAGPPQVLHLTQKVTTLDIPIQTTHCPNFFVHVLTVRDGEVYQDQVELFAPPNHKFLDVTVASDQKEYLPAKEAKVEVTVKGPDGKPVPGGDVSLGVIDTAVLYIQPENTPDVRSFYYGGRRSDRIGIGSSQGIAFGGRFEDLNKYEEYKLHGTPSGWTGGGGRMRGGRRLEQARGGLQGGEWAESDNNEGGPAGSDLAVGATAAPPGSPAAEEPGDGYAGFTGGGGGGAYGGRLAKGKESLDKDELKALKDGAPAKGRSKGDGGGGDGPMAPATVRKNFADTACWAHSLLTDASGRASTAFPTPDSLTTWRALAIVATDGTEVGLARCTFVTTKKLLLRLQAPRFFTERDEVSLSAIVHNYLASDTPVQVTMQSIGESLEIPGALSREAGVYVTSPTSVTVARDGEARVDWVVKVRQPGWAKITMTAQSPAESDAVYMEFPVYVHGIEKFVAWNGSIRNEPSSGPAANTAEVKFDVPKDRRVSSTELEIVLSPSIATSMIEALPYLIDYPYGCVEQTMSRFQPAVAVRKTLRDLGLSLEEIGKRREELATGYGVEYEGRMRNPVFSTRMLDHAIAASVARLSAFQHGDGGWGWWREGNSDPYMTAYVANGLIEAREAGVSLDAGMIRRAFEYLKRTVDDETDPHRLAYEYAVLAHGLGEGKDSPIQSSEVNLKRLLELYNGRDDLTDYAKALVALTYSKLGDVAKAQTICRNLEDFVKVDAAAGTAHWGREGGGWWYWYNDDIETNATILRAYLEVQPANPHVAPLARWLLNNRRGLRWKSTKDTAFAVNALCEYVKATGEINPDMTLTVLLDGKELRKVRVTKENLFAFDNRVILRSDAVGDGPHTLTFRKEGEGTLYYGAYLKYFTLEEDITAGGSEISLQRTYTRLIPKKVKKIVDEKEVEALDYDRIPLQPGEVLTSGQELEVQIRVKCNEPYEYLVFEDPKPAGCEPVELVSGSRWGSLVQNMELRDEKVVFFVGLLPKGEHTIAYKCRAEIPGEFHAMPTQGSAMYAPRVRGTSDETRIRIQDRK
ncbi:MAG: hypothetical protein HYY93_01375 [Planctomycetes bacterium]|nr:hypothetical protein [Planctomycetota bacterium]